nr:ribonuclease H-like domain-containing protein [Tanacetum cinerariifolium]
DELTRQVLLIMDEDNETHTIQRVNCVSRFERRSSIVSGGKYFSWSGIGKSVEVPSWMERLWAGNGGGTGVFIPQVVPPSRSLNLVVKEILLNESKAEIYTKVIFSDRPVIRTRCPPEPTVHARRSCQGYSLWEVILNGDSPTPTIIVDGVVQVIAPTTAEQRLAKKNELKARGTLLMTLPNKHQLKFNIHKDAKSFMKAIEKRFGGNKETKKVQKTLLKQQYENFNGTSSQSLDQIHDRIQKLISQLEILDLKQIDADDLEEMDLKWQMVMLTMRARRFLQRTGQNLGANGTAAIGFDISKVECYNCHRRGYFSRECRSPRDNRNKDTPRRTVPVEVSTSNALVSQCDAFSGYDWSFQADEELTNYALMAYSSSVHQVLQDQIMRDNALAELRKNFEKAEKEREELKLTLEKFQTSSKNLSKLLESQISEKTSLEYNSQVFNRQVFDCEELHSDESVNSVPTSPENDSKSVTTMLNFESSTNQPSKDMTKTLRPDAPIIEDWTSDSEDETEIKSVTKPKEPSFVPTSKHVKTPKESVKKVEPNKQAKNLRKNSQKSRGHKNSWNKKACFVCKSLNHLIKDCDYYETQTVQKHIQVSHGLGPQKTLSFLFDVQGNPQQALKDKEINGGYVAFGGNPKGGKITDKGKIKTGKLDFDDIYFVKELKFNLFGVSQMCDKKNNVLFTDTECVVFSSNYKLPDENHVLLRVPRENNMYNVDIKNGRKDDDNAASKDVNDVEPIVFDDEEVTMTMAQTLIKIKAKKPRLLNEQMAKRLHDDEVKEAAAREKQEKDDLERAQVLQQQYEDKEENIDWNVVAEQIQEKHLDNIRKYQSLKRNLVSIAQARKNMIIYLKNMVGYKMEHFRETPTNDPKEMIEEDVQNMLEIIPVTKFKVEALQVKYLIIDWDIHYKGSRSYWKIIRVSGITEAYQSFKDMLKGFDREDLVALWRLVKEKFSSAVPNVDKEKSLWVELKRSFEPNADDVIWKFQIYMHYLLLWKLHSNYGLHQVSLTTKRHDMFMLTEKDYPLSNGVMTLMLSTKLQVEEDSEMAIDLVMKIFIKANQPKSRSLDTSSK